MKYYAVYYPYGIRTLNTFGQPRGAGGGLADEILIYHSKAERDAAVSEDPEHVEAVKASNAALRRELRALRNSGYDPEDDMRDYSFDPWF